MEMLVKCQGSGQCCKADSVASTDLSPMAKIGMITDGEHQHPIVDMIATYIILVSPVVVSGELW